MKLFTCTDHDCFYPVGVASIILAESKEEAIAFLSAELFMRGLDPNIGFTLEEIDISEPRAIILRDGDY